MQLTHKIELKPTRDQAAYFYKAAGTARFVWNWALAEWKAQYQAGKKPKTMALKKQFNTIKYHDFPWLKEMHRDSHAQPFTYLQKAWRKFFTDIKLNQKAYEPQFKKKGKSRDSFYVANDKFNFHDQYIQLPKIGLIRMTEQLRFSGKILGATVSRTADRWFVAIQVDIPDEHALKRRVAHNTTGVDLGIKAAATLSSGEAIAAPKPLRALLRRLQIRGRRVSRKYQAAKKSLGFASNQCLPKGTKLSFSNNHKKSTLKLARLHAHIVNLRVDFMHKLTTRLCRENQAIVIEDLNVAGMMKNEKLSRAISDISFGGIRRQLEYKSRRYLTQLIIADRFYPSSKLCSICDFKNELLKLNDREWKCSNCGTHHDRDINAAINLKRLATATALPEANPLVTMDTGVGMVPALVGKVTSVRYECGLKDMSGQKENCEHFCSHF